jgi:hypothetical protein
MRCLISASDTNDRISMAHLAAAMLMASVVLSACSGNTGGSGQPGLLTSSERAQFVRYKSSTVKKDLSPSILMENGPPLFIYDMPINGKTDPNQGGKSPDAASFNELVYAAQSPPSSTLLSSKSTFGGSPGSYIELTNLFQAGEPKGVGLLGSCKGFTYDSYSGFCVAAEGSKNSGRHRKITEFMGVQSWPLYVGPIKTSNLSPGSYSFETTTDDGSYIVLADAAFTYAQPGNFHGVTGLTAGTAVVPNGGVHGPISVTGSVQINGLTCAKNLYWATFEWYEILGGTSGPEYSVESPGQGALAQATQAVVWGKITKGGSPLAGQSVSVGTPNGKSKKLVTDAGGCYGYNYRPFSSPTEITVSATVGAKKKTHQAQITEGQVSQTNFSF